MKIIDEVNRLNKSTNISKCPEGFYSTIKEIYDFLIEPHLPKVDNVKKWHALLLRYSLDKDAVLVLRKYSSDKMDGEWATRRGMITQYSNGSYVGIDNYFAHLIFALAQIGFVPDYDEFKTSMITRKLPIRFRRETQIERIKAAYPSVPFDNVGINDKNWKLSHVVSTNQNYPYPINRVLKENFPNTSNSDWKLSGDGVYYARRLDKEIRSEEVNALRIHFLRVCDPINHFLSPKTSAHKYPFGKDIGEERDLILYIKRKFMLRYGSLYNEYLRIVMDDPSDNRSIEDIGNKVMNLNTKIDYEDIQDILHEDVPIASKVYAKQDRKVSTTSKVPMNISQDQLFHMIALYISHGLSFRELEKRVLNIDSKARGGGFVSKSALNNMGVTASHKKTIRTKRQLAQACLTFDDSFGKTLKELTTWLNTTTCLDYHKIFI